MYIKTTVMAPTRTLSVVVPVYFNAESLPFLFEELQGLETVLLHRGLGLELIFVNDGSGDDSLQELLRIKRARPPTKVISLTRNFGYIAATKVGFQFVTGDAFIIVAADLQDPLDQIVPMLETWLQGHKFVISVRTSREDPLLTRLFARAYYGLVKRRIARDYPE